MTTQSRTTLKTYFNAGDIPTEAEFVDLIDSCYNLVDDASSGSQDLSANSIQMDITPVAPTVQEGVMWWNSTDHTLNIGMESGDTVLQVGQEMFVRALNKTGSDILNGQVVYINGAQGNRPTIALAQADSVATARHIGVATADIANNAEGYITSTGLVRDLDTNAYTEGDILYLSASTPGAMTATPPSSPNFSSRVAIVTVKNPAVGVIQVQIEPPLACNTALGTSNAVAPTQNAVKTYVDSTLSGTPTITDFTNAQHDHADAAGGGALSSSYRASQSDQENGTAVDVFVAPATQQYHPSAAKGWAYVTVSGGTPTLRKAYNCTITDNGAGDYTLTWGTDFSDAYYPVSVDFAPQQNVSGLYLNVRHTNTLAAGTFRIAFSYATDDGGGGFISNAFDVTYFSVIAFGDQ